MLFCWLVHFSNACCYKWEVQRHQTKRCYCKGPYSYTWRRQGCSNPCQHAEQQIQPRHYSVPLIWVGRGRIELTRIRPFEEFQEYSSCLRFTMRSEKNVVHGVDKNNQIPHFVPLSLSRYMVVLNLVIYPAVADSKTLTIPSIDQGEKRQI